MLFEYCGTKKPRVRRFEPPIAENVAIECIEESHRLDFASDSLLLYGQRGATRLCRSRIEISPSINIL